MRGGEKKEKWRTNIAWREKRETREREESEKR